MVRRTFAGALACLAAAAPHLAHAQQTPPAAAGTTSDTEAAVMLIIDASGSMRGRVEGRTKWEVAKETVAKVFADLPPERELGLMAYGHKGGKCDDIEVLTPPAKGTGPAIIAAIDTLSPKGHTPLSDAVRRAAKELKFQSKPATVVLVTDGIESCKQDPCALGAELAGDGMDFTTHVIGFGLSEKEGAQVACLAHNTGGNYYSVTDADSLKQALTETIGPAIDVKPVPKPAPEHTPREPKAEPKKEASAPAKPAAFAASFKNGVDLEKWDIVNENKNRYGVIEGRWVVAGTRHGMLENPKKENLLLAKTEVPAGDFDLVAEFTATLGEGSSHISIGIYKDEKNFVDAAFWRNKTYNWLKVGARRMADGQLTVQERSTGSIGAWHVLDDGSPTLKHIDSQGVRLMLSRRGIKVSATLELIGAAVDGDYKGPVVTEEVSLFGLDGRLAFQAGVSGCQFDFQSCGENIVRLDRIELRTP